MKKIAVFASGAGSNAKKIIDHFKGSKQAEIALVVSNKENAGVLTIARENDIATIVLDKHQFLEGNGYVPFIKEKEIDFIVLAGFLWKIPVSLIKAFPAHIINIHPALLPKYGGKGMYGKFVHQAVLANKEKESGITIHFVDEVYDHGDIILQEKCAVMEEDTPDSLARRVQQLEHEHYPVVIERLIQDN